MITSDVMRGFNSLIILSILMKGDNYGYQISTMIKEKTNGEYIMKETTLYSAFNRLEKQSLIQSYSKSGTKGKPRTYYKITPLGIEEYFEKLVEWEEVQAIIHEFVKEEKR
ncbi:PadR family transcriptional regulator [Desemzia sp. RIT804]|uniref:PadR family transcriptional regulator n=1 Tax=Desemzia sp. RIT 804 TaxID=2810209 RepID=UPI00194DCDDF|nr:PadR family transcriptional regulator [Desemzia sp. RIT 804]MBM6614752.1 PadR family transcriptional regulator [Desemzia sp. RIT 804]